MDRLATAIEKMHSPCIVGLDPRPEVIPRQVLEDVSSAESLAAAYADFSRAIIDAVSDIVPAVKPQIAMYEALGPAGISAYCRTTRYAQERGLYVIGDIKRGDIGSTAQAYAAHLSGIPGISGRGADVWHEDAVTVNPYLGIDGIRPFIEAAERNDKDIFVLCRTSNPSSAQLQDLDIKDAKGAAGTADTCSVQGPATVGMYVAGLIAQWGEAYCGTSGYSRVGAVVGATHIQDAARFRSRMLHTMFLVPGYGVQGGTAADAAALFNTDGTGAVINSSRGIIAAWKKDPQYSPSLTRDQALDCAAASAHRAAAAMRADIIGSLKPGSAEAHTAVSHNHQKNGS